MILMSGVLQINDGLGKPSGWWRPILGILAAVSASCSPQLTDPGTATLNPVEVLEKSPRVYHIRFEDFADSIETERAGAYLEGSLGPEFAIVEADTSERDDATDREKAGLQYLKAVRRFNAGAGRAALMHIRKALELAPGHGPSYVLLGRLLLAQGRVEEALDLFGKVVSWDMTDSEALVGLAKCYMLTGELDSARGALINAVIYDRLNLEAWSTLEVLGSMQKFTVADHDIAELGYVREDRGRHYDIVIDNSLEDCPSQATAWIVFASQRAVWRYEGKFKRTLGDPRYRRTYQEDIDCFMALAAAWKILSESDTTVCEGDYLSHVSKVAEDGYLVPHILFDYVCLEQPLAARNFRTDVIDEMRAYVETYILVPGG
jgi:tetratricopeptide (TPR) repeat protein